MSNNKLLIILFSFINLNASVTIHEYFPELFVGHEYRAEYIVCNLLKKNPINTNINYICIPWQILQRNTIQNKTPNLNNLPNKKFENAFTVCSHDEYEFLIPYFKKLGIKVLFTASADKKKHSGIEIYSMPYFARNFTLPAQNKDILYSFIGNSGWPVRKKLFSFNHPRDTVMVQRNTFHYFHQDKSLVEKYETEYRDVLSRSRFSLCPSGGAAGSYRFWESLQAGAIPVLISDNYLYPIGFDWTKCVIQVKEKDIKTVPVLLSKISKKQEEIMRDNCYKAYFLYSGNNFDSVIRQYYK